MAPELAGHIGHAVGFGLHGVIATATAAFITIKARDREEEFRCKNGFDLIPYLTFSSTGHIHLMYVHCRCSDFRT